MAKEKEIKRRGVTVARTFVPTQRDESELKEKQDHDRKLNDLYNKFDTIDSKLDKLLEMVKEANKNWN